VEFVNNYDFYKDFKVVPFLRDVGKHFRINSMLAKESVKQRLSGEEGMSFTEFAYQVFQGYDFYSLRKAKVIYHISKFASRTAEFKLEEATNGGIFQQDAS